MGTEVSRLWCLPLAEFHAMESCRCTACASYRKISKLREQGAHSLPVAAKRSQNRIPRYLPPQARTPQQGLRAHCGGDAWYQRTGGGTGLHDDPYSSHGNRSWSLHRSVRQTLSLCMDCTVFALALIVIPALAHLPRHGVESQAGLSKALYSLCISAYSETHFEQPI